MHNLPEAITAMGRTPEQYRISVSLLEQQLLQMPQVDCPLNHHFAAGVYAREVTIPAGSVVIGKLHRREHINILLKGEITVVTEEGQIRLKAPCTFVSPAFTKRAAFTHTEVVWTNLIATESTDPDEIERDVICPSYECPEFLEHISNTLALKE